MMKQKGVGKRRRGKKKKRKLIQVNKPHMTSMRHVVVCLAKTLSNEHLKQIRVTIWKDKKCSRLSETWPTQSKYEKRLVRLVFDFFFVLIG